MDLKPEFTQFPSLHWNGNKDCTSLHRIKNHRKHLSKTAHKQNIIHLLPLKVCNLFNIKYNTNLCLYWKCFCYWKSFWLLLLVTHEIYKISNESFGKKPYYGFFISVLYCVIIFKKLLDMNVISSGRIFVHRIMDFLIMYICFQCNLRL